MDDRYIRFESHKAIAILAYLAVSKDRQSRYSLLDLLWSEYDESRARSHLRRALYLIQKKISREWIEADRQSVGLNLSPDIWLDVEQFNKLSAEAFSLENKAADNWSARLELLTEAVNLYRGDFLQGYSLKGSQNFEEWRFFQAEALRDRFANALIKLVDGCTQRREFDLALHYAKRWLSLDSLNEQAHCRLMELYEWQGQRALVVKQFEECQKLLMNALGITPQASTTSLYREIVQGRHALPKIQADKKPADRKPAPYTCGHTASALQPRQDPALPIGPVFVERERELERLFDHLDRAQVNQGGPVFISGEAGLGKTALACEFARRAQLKHRSLLFQVGSCDSFTGLGDPYHPFREILCRLTGDFEAQRRAGSITEENANRLEMVFPLVLKTLLDSGPDLIGAFVQGEVIKSHASRLLTPEDPASAELLERLKRLVDQKTEFPQDPNLQQLSLFEQFSRVLIEIAARSPLLLFLDDLQWADEGSIGLLFHLAKRLAQSRILLIGAYRPEEIATRRSPDQHSLETAVNEFRRSFGDILIDLADTENHSFIDAYVDSEPNNLGDDFRERLFQLTGGNPLFVSELLRDMVEQGDVAQDRAGRWGMSKSYQLRSLPTRVEAVIAERVRRLSEETRAMLKIACVEGEYFHAEVIAQVLNLPAWEVVDRLSARLERRHHLVRAQDFQRYADERLSRYRFHHILIQNYLYQNLNAIERSYLHEAVGKALEALYRADTGQVALQLAWHFQKCGDLDKAARYLFQAGQKAISRSANEAAIDHFNQGLDNLRQLPPSLERDRRELDFYIGLGIPLVLSRGHAVSEVEKTYSKARRLAEEIGSPAQQFHVLHGLRRYCLFRGELIKARDLGERLLTIAESANDKGYLARAYMMQGENQYRMGEFIPGLESCARGIAAYDSNLSKLHIFSYGNDTVVGLWIFRSLILYHLGYPEQAFKAADEMISLIDALDHPFTTVFGLCFVAGVYQLCARLETMNAWVDRLLRISDANGFALYQAWGGFLKGWIRSEKGDLGAGIAQMEQSLNAWQKIGSRLLLPNFLYFLAAARLKTERFAEAETLLNQALKILAETQERTFEAEIYRLKGDARWLGEGDLAAAAGCYRRALEVARLQNARSWELRAAISLRRLPQPDGGRREAEELLSEVYGWFTEGFDIPDLRQARELLLESQAGG